jgi:transposase
MPTPPEPRPIPKEVYEAVVKDLMSGQYGRNEIAKRQNVGRATVTRVAQENDLDPSAKANQTQHATRAVAVATKARKEQLKAQLLDDIQALRVRAWSAWSKEVVTREGIEVLRADMPPLPEVAAAYRSIGIALDGVFKLEAAEAANGDSVQGARDFLVDLHSKITEVTTEWEERTGVALDSAEARQIIQGEVVADPDGDTS